MDKDFITVSVSLPFSYRNPHDGIFMVSGQTLLIINTQCCPDFLKHWWRNIEVGWFLLKADWLLCYCTISLNCEMSTEAKACWESLFVSLCRA